LEVSADCSSSKLAVIVGRSSVNCSVVAVRDWTGATGIEESETGEGQQQHPPHVIAKSPPQAPPDPAGVAGCHNIRNENRMKAAAFTSLFLRRFFGFVELLHVLGRVLLEILLAAFAAKLDFASLVLEHVRLAHIAKLLIRNHAGLERIFALLVTLFIGGQRRK
jgi:hypothetical protein